MVTNIFFDERSVYYDKYAIFRNQYVVKKLCKDSVEEVNKRGYFYLNQAYEFGGISWDTENDNPCFSVAMISWVKEDNGEYRIVISGNNEKGEDNNDDNGRSIDAQGVS